MDVSNFFGLPFRHVQILFSAQNTNIIEKQNINANATHLMSRAFNKNELSIDTEITSM